MKKRIALFILVIFVLNSAPAFAQNTNGQQQSDQPDASSGMEARKVNNTVTVLVPKGAKMHRTNETTYVEESSDEYAARNFTSVEGRLNKLERENKEFREDIKKIKLKLDAIEKR